jgi:hypothetical protein
MRTLNRHASLRDRLNYGLTYFAAKDTCLENLPDGSFQHRADVFRPHTAKDGPSVRADLGRLKQYAVH